MTLTAASPALPIQIAMFQKATADTALMELVTGVFDEVPEGQPKPYVVIGEVLATPRNAHGEFGRTVVPTWHIWSDHAGFSEALDIENRLIQLFDHQPLTVEGQHVVSVRYDFSQTLRDPDPAIRHVVLRWRVTTEQDDTDSS